MQSAIEYAAIPTINLTPLFLVTNPLTKSSQSDILQLKSQNLYINHLKSLDNILNSINIHFFGMLVQFIEYFTSVGVYNLSSRVDFKSSLYF